MTNFTLTHPTDDQLNAAFAKQVAGYYVKNEFPGTDFPFTAWQGDKHLSDHRWASADGPLSHITPFTRSMDAVLPWLEKYPYVEIHRVNDDGWQVAIINHKELAIGYEEGVKGEAWYDTLPRACVIALLRANGVEVVT